MPRSILLIPLVACWVSPDEIQLAKQGIECFEGDMDDKAPAVLDLANEADRVEPSCGVVGEPDVAVRFTASTEGCHRVDVIDAGDATVSVFGACSVDERACGSAGRPQFAWVGTGEAVVVAVEGADAAPTVDVSLLTIAEVTLDVAATGNTDTNANEDPYPDVCAPDGTTGGLYADYVRFDVPREGYYRAVLDDGFADTDHTLSVHRACRLGAPDGCSSAAPRGQDEVLEFFGRDGGELTFRIATTAQGRGAWRLRMEWLGE